MVLSWGKPTIIVKCLDVVGAIWRKLETPVEETTNFEEAEGDELEAKEEGGDVVDSMRKSGSATLNFEEFVKKGHKLPFAKTNGKVERHYAVYVQPEDPDAVGLFIPEISVSVRTTMTAADGIRQVIAAKAVKTLGAELYTLGTVSIAGAAGSFTPSIVALEAASETESDESESEPTA